MKLFRKKIIKDEEKRLANSFHYAIDGIFSAFKSEKNMRIHCVMLFLVILSGVIFKISYYEWLICLILFAIVLTSELFNTAIETVVDMVMPYKDTKAKIAKDVSAGAVLVVAFFAALIGLIIFIPKFISLISF